MHRTLFAALMLTITGAAAAMTAGCQDRPTGEDEVAVSSEEALSVVSSFVARGTSYYPHNSALEGGFLDRKGRKLQTLQQFLAGDAAYVSVAMDTKAFPYGTRLRIHELNEKYGREIVFRVVDTGGAFRNKGRTRIDICTANRTASLDPTINGQLHIDHISELDGPDEPVTPSVDGGVDDPSGDDSDASTPTE